MRDDPAAESAYWIARTSPRVRKKLLGRDWVVRQVPLHGVSQMLYRPLYIGGLFKEPKEVSLSFWDIGYLAFWTEEAALIWIQHLEPRAVTANGKPPRRVEWVAEPRSDDCDGSVVAGVALGALLFGVI
jgi:hypothetical protein